MWKDGDYGRVAECGRAECHGLESGMVNCERVELECGTETCELVEWKGRDCKSG